MIPKTKLKEGYTTGTCAAAAALASALWQRDGNCPVSVKINTPTGKDLILDIEKGEDFTCKTVKDSGDDPDITNGCTVWARLDIKEEEGSISFAAGEGVGTITKKGMKLPVGEAAINPVPRQMIEKAVRSVFPREKITVTVGIEGGRELAAKTYNPRLGVKDGLSVLGTTGIVHPMDENAMKEALRLELSMYRAEKGCIAGITTGYPAEKALKDLFGKDFPVLVCTNYVGFALDCAEKMGFETVIIAGRRGKTVKLGADIMYLHSHSAGGQREVVCTHAALCGAEKTVIEKLYMANTTAQMGDILAENNIAGVWESIAEAAEKNCTLRVHSRLKTPVMILDEKDRILALSKNAEEMIKCREK